MTGNEKRYLKGLIRKYREKRRDLLIQRHGQAGSLEAQALILYNVTLDLEVLIDA